MNEVLSWGPSGVSLVAIVLSAIAMRRTRKRGQNAEALEARTSQREDTRDQKADESNLMQAINRLEANLRADMSEIRKEVSELRKEVSATRIEIRITASRSG